MSAVTTDNIAAAIGASQFGQDFGRYVQQQEARFRATEAELQDVKTELASTQGQLEMAERLLTQVGGRREQDLVDPKQLLPGPYSGTDPDFGWHDFSHRFHTHIGMRSPTVKEALKVVESRKTPVTQADLGTLGVTVEQDRQLQGLLTLKTKGAAHVTVRGKDQEPGLAISSPCPDL